MTVDRIHLVAGPAQRRDPQAPVGFNADDDLVGFLGIRRDQRVQLPDPAQPLRQPPRCPPGAGLIHQIRIVMLFAPVVADEDYRSPPFPIRFLLNLFRA
jgi:hypothetical protein